MIPLAEARSMVLGSVFPLEPVTLPLAEALGCVTGGAVVAREALPLFANSAMDGFAVRAADTAGAPVTLRVVATALAGSAPSELRSGEAVRIMTGAPMPLGADAVCMVERSSGGPTEGEICLLDEVQSDAFVRHPGDDIAAGTVAVAARTVLRAGHLGVLASLGHTKVSVHPRPRVGIVSTGDELVPAGTTPGPGSIRDANGPSLAALVRSSGWDAVDLGIVADDAEAIRTVLTNAGRTCDVVVASGGVSVGEADVVKAVLRELCGASARWLQVAIKPAKPFAFGLLGEGPVPLFGLPGNPVSAMVSFEIFARPAIRVLAGHRQPGPAMPIGIAEEDLLRPADDKVHFLRVVASYGTDGLLHVRPAGTQQSHVLSAMAGANALAVVPGAPGARRGDRVHLILIEPGDVTASAAGEGEIPW